MRYRLLGKSGLRVCLGTMTFMDTLNWGSPKEESRRIYSAFVEEGGNFIDTANSYGTSEEYLGEFMATDRQRIVIGTKYTGSPPMNDPNSAGNHRKSLTQSVEGSLRRLRTDYIDLLWVHSWDFMTPVDELMRALDDMVRLGKVLYVGISNAPAWVVAQANTVADLRGWTPFIGLQVEYNLLEREVERELLPMARTLDIGVTAWTPLASGWLTGKYSKGGPAATWKSSADRDRLDDPVATGFVQRSESNRLICRQVCIVAEEIGCAPAHVALNWLRSQGVIPILGARKVEQIRENLACLNYSLSQEELRSLDEVSRIRLGFPHDFLASNMVKHHVYGGMHDLIDDHRRYKPQLLNVTPAPQPKRRERIERNEKFIN
jgi:aryl-alcohol dehydrogenase-like predicted oxidoreductase